MKRADQKRRKEQRTATRIVLQLAYQEGDWNIKKVVVDSDNSFMKTVETQDVFRIFKAIFGD